jgi:hypothetical protein
MPVLPLQKRLPPLRVWIRNWFESTAFCPSKPPAAMACALSILTLVHFAFVADLRAQEQPPGDEIHEREELGVNPYTAPSIARIFEQLDKLKPVAFEQLRRPLPETLGRSREEKALMFGQLIADGFLIVEAERKNLVEDFGRVLLRQARALGVAERVTRHSSSLTEHGGRGDWAAVRGELVATQADVEQAMIELRDQTMAHLISLGGWLRGLEIAAGAVATNFSPARARVLAEPELVDYFAGEMKTLPPSIAHTPLVDRIRFGVNSIQRKFTQSAGELTLADVQAVRAQAAELNTTIRELHDAR